MEERGWGPVVQHLPSRCRDPGFKHQCCKKTGRRKEKRTERKREGAGRGKRGSNHEDGS